MIIIGKAIKKDEILKIKAVTHKDTIEFKDKNDVVKYGNIDLWKKFYQSLDVQFFIRNNYSIKSLPNYNEIYSIPNKELAQITKLLNIKSERLNAIKKEMFYYGKTIQLEEEYYDLEVELVYLKQRLGELNANNQDETTYINYTEFLNIINLYYFKAVEKIIQGDVLKINGLGQIEIKKVERNKNKKVVDFGKTNKNKKEGIDKIVYHISDDYCLIYWSKIREVKNIRLYKFEPSRNNNTKEEGTSFINRFLKGLKKHPEYQLRYKKM